MAVVRLDKVVDMVVINKTFLDREVEENLIKMNIRKGLIDELFVIVYFNCFRRRWKSSPSRSLKNKNASFTRTNTLKNRKRANIFVDYF